MAPIAARDPPAEIRFFGIAPSITLLWGNLTQELNTDLQGFLMSIAETKDLEEIIIEDVGRT